MKTKLVFTVFLSSLLLLYGCSQNEDNVQEPQSDSQNLTTVKGNSAHNGSSQIHRKYKKEQAEVLATFGAIAESIIYGAGNGPDGDYMNQLISFHDYEGYTFTEFNYDLITNVGYSYTAAENEAHERSLFGTLVDPEGVQKFATVPGTLKVAVYYGNVANVTFISDFELLIGGELNIVNNLITLVFVKTDGEWKIVHEHHSPKEVVASTGSETGSYPSEPADLSSPAQQEVEGTFVAIGKTIEDNSGTGPENMDELISFHAYGPKFTEFNYDGATGYSFNSEENEANERAFLGGTRVKPFAYKANTLNIVVYHENVANVTFISDFVVDGFGPINNLITLLFVKIKGEWKIVHEHHSPENLP